MNTYLDLSKGLYTDSQEIEQPAGTYTYLKNGIRNITGSITNERGTITTYKFPATDARVVGQTSIDNSTILFSYSSISATSEIGILGEDGKYEVITKDPSLNFSLSTIIRAVARKNYKSEIIVYFTGKGLPMRVINLSSIPATNFNDSTKLVVTASMPQTVIASVTEGGSLPTGVYQFGVRLVTKSDNKTAISLLTNLVPIIDDDNSSQDRADGAPPQSESNKAINLSILNVDTGYELIEIVAITYIGTGNIVDISTVAKIPIQKRSNINFTYSSLSQIKEKLDIEILGVEASSYDSAEYILQKDGILVLAGLTSSIIDYNFQSAANKVKVKYVIKELNHYENIQITNGVDVGTNYAVGEDYNNSLTSTNYKGYMRDEVYSFSISPIFTNWIVSNAYHIPSPLGQQINVSNKLLETYVSEETYPTERGYPVGNVTHHKMPSLIDEPHVVQRNGTQVIRILGLNFDLADFLSSIPENVSKNIIGYVIGRQKRDENNKSILSQGIASGHVLYSQNSYVPSPFSGNTHMYSTANVEDLSIVAFYSPESIITKESLRQATAIKPVIQLKGTSYLVKDKRTDDNKFAHVLLNYTTTTPSRLITSNVKSIIASYTQYIEAGPELTRQEAKDNLPTIPITGTSNSIVTWRNPGYLLLKLTGELPLDSLMYSGKGDVYFDIRKNKTDLVYLNGIEQGVNQSTGRGITQRHLYNLTRERTRQYGAIYDAKYIYTTHKLVGDFSTEIECFNGDTFISKFSVMSSMNPDVSTEYSIDMRALSYYWVESTINTNYRHYKSQIGTEGGENFTAGTLPYYPKVKILYTDSNTAPGLFNYSPSLGHSTGYNKQYSFENSIRSYVPTNIEIDTVTQFPNRLIYSETSIEGEQLDSYRIFLPNNFQDIPKEKGSITNLFTLSNTLYVHTERSLWKTYFNEQVTQVTSAGEVYLGNGGIFSRPATEIISVKGGYAGTTSSTGSVTTPFGHFFLDTQQKKLFMFTDKLEEISNKGMSKWFRENISEETDNPANLKGYSAVFDYDYKRFIFTKIGNWTISYSTELNSWSSYHDYLPYTFFSNADNVYYIDESTIYQINKGNYGVYSDNIPSSMQLEFVINDEPVSTKTLDNLILHTTSEKESKLQHYDTFSTLHCYNKTRNTGKCRLTVPKSFDDEFLDLGLYECFAKLKSNEFRISVPSDLVLDVNQDIFSSYNLDDSRDYRPSMSGKWFKVNLSYNNLRDNKFTLHTVGRLFRNRIR